MDHASTGEKSIKCVIAFSDNYTEIRSTLDLNYRRHLLCVMIYEREYVYQFEHRATKKNAFAIQVAYCQ